MPENFKNCHKSAIFSSASAVKRGKETFFLDITSSVPNDVGKKRSGCFCLLFQQLWPPFAINAENSGSRKKTFQGTNGFGQPGNDFSCRAVFSR